MTTRATMEGHYFPFIVFVDGVRVGRGNQTQCTALMNELNADNEKCNAIKKLHTTIRGLFG